METAHACTALPEVLRPTPTLTNNPPPRRAVAERASVQRRQAERWRVRLRGWRRAMLLVCVSIAAAVPLGATILENFRVITPGIAFRSGQLSGDSLQSHIDRYHIQSVINLRGANPGDDWYESECAIATKNGVIHVDMPTDSLFPPTAEELHTWMAVLDRCPKPLLVHCQSGIDRTGLVAAICVLRCDPHGTIAEARSQLGIFYGHLPWKENRARFLGLIDAYEKWLRHRQLQHTPARFEEWALTAYRGPSN